ncbi:phage Gp19/Gp15/Gp42 family protein [Bifidobacterium amazonense]|uniref:Phage Gp19/Gp15/Gp42 family protein n=1 Tax=Bifidobacterium amazonense TaxID=2809027 RepID=A0ABS9VSE3_9BIFI|nr:Gp19/Gp15/Gp42 family protein [Bifidobacterium amazonense]MCH9274998.1 phage Gp19/Gp15/Gp42 family protein [Bifidobacterium amazonense]
MDDSQNPTPPFASVDDLASRWHALTEDEQDRARALLDDASDLIMAECPRYMESSAATLKRIACAMVKRAMIGGDEAMGVTQTQQTAGPFSQMFSYSNPSGDLYLTKSEKRSLGCGVQVAWSVSMIPEEADP